MYKMKRVVVIGVLALVLASLSLAPVALAQSANTDAEIAANQGRGTSLHITGTLIIHDITVEEVYAFTSDLSNDHLWYPGTFSSVLVEGDGGKGSVYEEEIFFGGAFATIYATVVHLVPNRHFWFTSDTLLTNETRYDYKQRGNNVEFTLDSFVQVPEGTTDADMELYLTGVFYNLLANLGRTGEIIIPAHGNQ